MDNSFEEDIALSVLGNVSQTEEEQQESEGGE